MKQENIPKCRECKYMKTPCNCLANANNRWRPRSVCYCTHPKAKEVFDLFCPRSPREPACIGFTPMGGDKPQIKTSPHWCPLRHPDLLQTEK